MTGDANDADIWAAFASTPAPREDGPPKDDSLHAFQRRLLGEAGRRLEIIVEDYQAAAAALDELRHRYEAVMARAAAADRLIERTYRLLRRTAEREQFHDAGELILDLQDYLDA